MDTIAHARARWASFPEEVNAVRAMGTDNLSHFGNGYTYEGGLSLQQNPEEFAALLLLLHDRQPKPAVYLEIGSASGGAARAIQAKVGFQRMLSIDDGGHHRYPELPENFSHLPMVHLRANSHSPEAAAWLAQQLAQPDPPATVDVAFIDGDHSYEGAWQDVELCRRHWSPGSWVIFHDTVACEGVRRVWQRGTAERIWTPLAEYVGAERPLGIGVGAIL